MILLAIFVGVVLGGLTGMLVARPLAEGIYRLRHGKKMPY